jgi:hypothetical protein
MMMYQILCGHVNYALGKTRMQVKKQKDNIFWIHVYINLLKILKSYLTVNSILSIFHIIITVHLLLLIITTNIVIRVLLQKLMVSELLCVTYNLVIVFNMYPPPFFFNITML